MYISLHYITFPPSEQGWDYVIQGLIKLSFTLMDSTSLKASSRSSGHELCQLLSIAVATSPSIRMCQLGCKILTKCFKVSMLL